MITVRCYGHIGTSLGKPEVELNEDRIQAKELVDKVRSMSKETEPGFNRYNTIILIEDGEAFVSASDRTVLDGQRVALIPFSHGG